MRCSHRDAWLLWEEHCPIGVLCMLVSVSQKKSTHGHHCLNESVQQRRGYPNPCKHWCMLSRLLDNHVRNFCHRSQHIGNNMYCPQVSNIVQLHRVQVRLFLQGGGIFAPMSVVRTHGSGTLHICAAFCRTIRKTTHCGKQAGSQTCQLMHCTKHPFFHGKGWRTNQASPELTGGTWLMEDCRWSLRNHRFLASA